MFLNFLQSFLKVKLEEILTFLDRTKPKMSSSLMIIGVCRNDQFPLCLLFPHFVFAGIFLCVHFFE